MAAEHWFRWHHGTVNDPKWRVVAARASSAMSRNVTVGHVLSVWACMLECASQSNPRGMLTGWDDEDVAAGLGMDADEVHAIRVAMQGKTLDDDTLSGWKARQPKAEDLRAADRKRAQRERENAVTQDVTKSDENESHGMSRNVTTETETETEEKPPLPPKGESADGESGQPKPKREAKIGLESFLQACRDAGESAIPKGHGVFVYADSIGLPRDFVTLAWRWFKGQYADRRQAGVKGWRKTFRNAVEGNWPRYWYADDTGAWQLTTAGKQAKLAADAEKLGAAA